MSGKNMLCLGSTDTLEDQLHNALCQVWKDGNHTLGLMSSTLIPVLHEMGLKIVPLEENDET